MTHYIRLLGLILFITSFKLNIVAQSIYPASGNYTTCPDEFYRYTINPNPDFSSCGGFTWSLTNGSFVSGQSVTSKTTSAFYVDVIWNNVAGLGTLTVTSLCDQGTLNVSESYAIKSLAGKNLQNARTLQTLPYCSTATIALAVDEMLLLNTGGATGISQQYADGYEWSLPVGWSFSGSSTSNFINIYPNNGCQGGIVSVRAYVNCVSGKKYSNSASISVNRPMPSIIVTPPSGYAGPGCGSSQAVTFTVTPISCAADYVWVFPSGWLQSPVYTASNSISVTPSGSPNDGGQIKVTVNLSCQSQLASIPYQLTYHLPSISVASKVCAGGTSVTLNNVSHNTPVTWSVSSNLKINSGQGTPNAVVATLTSSTSGTATIDAIPNCPNTTVPTKSVWAGIPNAPGPFIVDPSPMCLYQFSSGTINHVPGADSYNWIDYSPWIDVVGGSISGAIEALKAGGYNFYIQTSNVCGMSESLYSVYVQSTYECEGQQFLIYPNPASSSLIIESPATQLNAEGAIYNERELTKKFSIDKTRAEISLLDLPEGRFFVKIKGTNMKESTKQIVVKH